MCVVKRPIDPILECLWSSSYCSCKIAHLLPHTDLTQELLDILLEQCELIDGIIEERYFEMADLEEYSSKCVKLVHQVNLIELNKH